MMCVDVRRMWPAYAAHAYGAQTAFKVHGKAMMEWTREGISDAQQSKFSAKRTSVGPAIEECEEFANVSIKRLQ